MKIWAIAGHADYEGKVWAFHTREQAVEAVKKISYDAFVDEKDKLTFKEYCDAFDIVHRKGGDSYSKNGHIYVWTDADGWNAARPGIRDLFQMCPEWFTVTECDFN